MASTALPDFVHVAKCAAAIIKKIVAIEYYVCMTILWHNDKKK